MESIKALREICQAPRRSADNWHMKHISRKPSIYITWLLLHTPITANGATFLFLLTGIVACLVFSLGTNYAFLVGSILLEVWYVMDMVDGEIARYRKQPSFTGVYFDIICHYIIHPFLFFCIGLGLYKMENNNLIIFLASLLAGYSVTMISISSDMLQATLYYKLKNARAVSAVVAEGSGTPEKNKTSVNKKKNIPARVFSLMHLLCTMPTAMNMIFLASLLQCFIEFNLMKVLVIFFAVAATIVWIARVAVFILQKKMDREGPSI